MTYPSDILCECSAQDGTCHGSDTPHPTHDAKVLTAEPQWYNVGDNDFSESNNAASANALDGPADEHVGEILRHGGDNRSNTEEENSD